MPVPVSEAISLLRTRIRWLEGKRNEFMSELRRIQGLTGSSIPFYRIYEARNRANELVVPYRELSSAVNRLYEILPTYSRLAEDMESEELRQLSRAGTTAWADSQAIMQAFRGMNEYRSRRDLVPWEIAYFGMPAGPVSFLERTREAFQELETGLVAGKEILAPTPPTPAPSLPSIPPVLLQMALGVGVGIVGIWYLKRKK